MKLLGISGTNGAGKDSVGEYLAKKHGWFFVSVTDILRDELKRKGLPPDRHHTQELSSSWRRELGMGVMIDKGLEVYKSQNKTYTGLAIASLRHPGEADAVHALGGQVIWVDADSQIRYQRITSANRGRIDDQKTFEEFLKEEQLQMSHSGDAATLSMEGVKAKADIFIQNDTSSINDFYQKLDQTLGL